MEQSTAVSPVGADPPSVLIDTEEVVSEAASVAISISTQSDFGTIVSDVSSPDHSEEEIIKQFVANGCSCKLADGGPCCKRIQESEFQESRDECRELSREELDLVVMGQLRACNQHGPTTQKQKQHNKERESSKSMFRFGGQRVCIKTFCFLHGMGRSKFEAIKKSWEENGLRPRSRKHKAPHNTTKLSDVEHTVRFILHYAENNAILLPGRIPGYKRDDLQLLPSSVTKREVWQLYHQASSEAEGIHAVCYSLFCQFWRKLTPQIVVTKPMSDLCWTCQQNSCLIMRAHNRPVEEKSEVH